MKTIKIKLTDTEYKSLKEKAEKWNETIENYLVITGQLYFKIVERKREVLRENYQLKKEIEARNKYIDKYQDILQKYYEYAGDLPKDENHNN